MFQVGVVGSVSSVKRIIDMAVGIDNNINFIAYPYVNFQDTRKIITEHDHKIDVWFFSGELPYLIAKKVLNSDEHLVYVENTEASLYKCFIQMTEKQNKSLERFSLDDTTEVLLDGAMQQLDLQQKEVYLKTFGVETNPKDLYDFHLKLWNDGKIDAVITSFEKIYEELSAAGVPTYWYSISHMEIDHSFRVLKEKVRTFYFKEMQTGIVIIDITGFYKIIEKAKSPYEIQYLELRLKENLIKLCESLDGSLIEKGNGRYIIHSSRGLLERRLKMVQQTIEFLKLESETSVSVGIGYGETVFSAELNALQAIEQSKEKTEVEIVILQEDGKIVEAAGKDEELTYSNLMKDEDFLGKLKDANISLRTFNRIAALLTKMDKRDFTTKDLVTHLQIEDRNARRIVTNLNKAELIKEIGEKSLSTRGRPSKIYQITNI